MSQTETHGSVRKELSRVIAVGGLVCAAGVLGFGIPISYVKLTTPAIITFVVDFAKGLHPRANMQRTAADCMTRATPGLEDFDRKAVAGRTCRQVPHGNSSCPKMSEILIRLRMKRSFRETGTQSVSLRLGMNFRCYSGWAKRVS